MNSPNIPSLPTNVLPVCNWQSELHGNCRLQTGSTLSPQSLRRCSIERASKGLFLAVATILLHAALVPRLAAANADLQLLSVEFAPQQINAGASLSNVSWFLLNNGPDTLIRPTFQFDFFLSRNSTPGDADDVKVDSASIPNPLFNWPAGATAKQTVFGVAVPTNAAGAYHLVARVAPVGTDSNLANNASASLATLETRGIGFPLLSPAQQGNAFSVSVATITNQTYVLEFKSSLDAKAWTAVAAISGDGTTRRLAHQPTSSTQGFYRVVATTQPQDSFHAGDVYLTVSGENRLLRSGRAVAVRSTTNNQVAAVVQSLTTSNGPFTGFQTLFARSNFAIVSLPTNASALTLERLQQSLTTASTGIGVESVDPVFVDTQSGLLFAATDEVIVCLKARVDPQTYFGANWPNVRPVRGATRQFILRQPKANTTQVLGLAIVHALNPAADWAEPNFLAEMRVLATPPSDPLFNEQWHLHNTGQLGGTPDADVDALEAWDLSRGNGVTVAVIDDGVDYQHPDLKPNLFNNAAEIPNNGVDDDHNGYVDDVNGWDFGNYWVFFGFVIPFGDDNDPSPASDSNKHGTSVAGVAAATGNNALGVSGSAPDARVLPIRLFDPDESGSFFLPQDIEATAIYYAAGRSADGKSRWAGADVINMSYGGANSDPTGRGPAVLDAAFTWAATEGRNGRGCVLVAAAGNEDASQVIYPAAHPNVIAIGASTDRDVRAAYSNRGSKLDVVAPSGPWSSKGQLGARIRTTDRRGDKGYNIAPGAAGDYTPDFGGTSSASPLTAGVVALLLSAKPELTSEEVRQILRETSDQIGPLPYTNGRNDEYGYGRINAFKALQRVLGNPTNPPPAITHAGPAQYTPGGTVEITNTFSYTGTLLSLGWQPQLPSGWQLLFVTGNGTPEINPQRTGIVWTGTLPPSPIQMRYTVQVFSNATGTAQLRGQVEYQLAGSVNPTTAFAAPDPLPISPAPSLNRPPVANSQTISASPTVPVNITLTGSDADNDPLTFSVLTNPLKATLAGAAPNLTYTANAAASGTDSFTFRVSDGKTNSAPATVTINITTNPPTQPPVAFSQSVSNLEDTAVNITLTGSDPSNRALTFAVQSLPAKGSLSGTAPNLTYTPRLNENGADSFTFIVSNGVSASTPATVSINITPVNDQPTLNALADQTISGTTTVSLSGITSGAANEAQTLTVTATSSNPALIPNPTVNYSSPAATGSLTFTPASGQTGAVTITVRVQDNGGTANGGQDTISRPFNVTVTLSLFPSGPPSITSFSPHGGVPGITVTITGTNFSPNPGSNIVYCGAVRASVVASSATTLTFAIPFGATLAPVTVTTRGLTAYSREFLEPTFRGGGDLAASAFAQRIDLVTPNHAQDLTVADVNGDGRPDLLITEAGGRMLIFLNFSSPGVLNASSFSSPLVVPVPSTPDEVAVGDFDGDGRLDLAVVGDNADVVPVYRNNTPPGAGSAVVFDHVSNLPAGVGLDSVVIHDLDADGRPDIIVNHGNIPTSSVGVLRNVSVGGTVSFAAEVVFSMSGYPESIGVADLDRDGRPDLIAVNRASGALTVFRNLTTSPGITATSFASSVNFPVGTFPLGLGIGDLDGDGRMDMVTALNSGGALTVLRNLSSPAQLGPGAFGAPVSFGRGYRLAISDLNGDGKLDILASGDPAATVQLYQNMTAGPGITSTSFSVGFELSCPGPQNVAIADLDLDGRPELLATSFFPNVVSIYRNAMPLQAAASKSITERSANQRKEFVR